MDATQSTLPAGFRPRGPSLRGMARSAWLYGLVVIPVLTEIAETGGLPRSAREWLTEVVAGLLIVALVRQVRKEQLAMLALARSDSLTGLGNQRAFEEALEDECARARRSTQPLCLVYIDIDSFKQVNDCHGHGRGDQVLRQLAAAMVGTARVRVDHGFRIGGDGFALLLPGSTAAQAQAIVERIRDECARSDAVWVAGPLGISAGIVEFDVFEAAESFVRRADTAMYRAKTGAGTN